jgi:hypothetical protein
MFDASGYCRGFAGFQALDIFVNLPLQFDEDGSNLDAGLVTYRTHDLS